MLRARRRMNVSRAAGIGGLIIVGLAVVATSRAADSTPPAAATPGVAARPTPGWQGKLPLVDAGPFDEKTTVQGKIEVPLEGVWLLIAHPQIAPGKFKTFPQLLKVTTGKNGLEFHLLDVRLPDAMQQAVRDADRHTLVAWEPSEADRKTLAESWSHLPPAKQKAVEEFLFSKIDYTVAAPDRYAEAFPKRSEAMDKVLAGTKVAVRIAEQYKPRDLPIEAHISQLAGRTSLYGVKSVEKDVLKGDTYSGFLAMGAGTPLPYEFAGPFTMYRVASP